MTSKLLLLAGAAALVLAGASAEPPHDTKCPPGMSHCNHGQQGGPGSMAGPMAGPMAAPKSGLKAPGPVGPVWKGGPGWSKSSGDWHWQDDRGGWHRDHDRYWRPDYRGGFVARDRLFFVLRQNHYNRFDGDPYWFRGRFVIKTFDRFGRPVIVELNPYTGDFIGIVRF